MIDCNNCLIASDSEIDSNPILMDIPNRWGNVEATLNNSKYYYLNYYTRPLSHIINIFISIVFYHLPDIIKITYLFLLSGILFISLIVIA